MDPTTLHAGAALALLASATFGLLRYRRLRKSRDEIARVLSDVARGNGNRRVLSKPRDPLAPVAFHVNQTVESYENRLSQLRAKERATDRLLTSFSHDIRTPLTVIRAYLDAIDAGTVTEAEREAYLRVVRERARDLSSYADSMFEWFKLHSGEHALTLESADIAELTRGFLINWIPAFEERGMGYEVSIPERRVEIPLDRNAYSRILGNIAQNVLDHSHASVVEIRVAESERGVRISIADDGIGIPEKDLGHAFERLYTGDPARKRSGSGLGLSIAHELARLLGGRLSVESTPQVRTEFALELYAPGGLPERKGARNVQG